MKPADSPPDSESIPPLISGVLELLMEVERAVFGGFPFLALMGALTVPDIMARLQAEDGKTNPDRYMAWFDANLPRKGTDKVWGGHLTADSCYHLRCSLLHQARTGHDNVGYSRVLLTDPTSPRNAHANEFEVGGGKYLNISPDALCGRMVEAGKTWLWAHWDEPIVKRNLEQSVRRHKDLDLPAPFMGVHFIG